MTNPTHPLAQIYSALEFYAAPTVNDGGQIAKEARTLVNQMMGAEMKSAEEYANKFEEDIEGVDFWREVCGREKLLGLIEVIKSNAFAAGLAAQPDAKKIRDDALEEACHVKIALPIWVKCVASQEVLDEIVNNYRQCIRALKDGGLK